MCYDKTVIQKQIKLKDERVDYLLKKSKRARRLRLAIYCDGSFVVTAPDGLDVTKVENYILQKAKWVLEKLRLMKERGRSLIFMKQSKREYLKLKDQALKIAEQKAKKFNEIYGFCYNNIRVRNQKTRWGSCSRKGNLNYNYKIALLSEKSADYIIVHELCHLKEFNHSRRFWDLVGKTVPDYRERVKEIKKLA